MKDKKMEEAIKYLKSKSCLVYRYMNLGEFNKMNIPGNLVQDDGKERIIIIVEGALND